MIKAAFIFPGQGSQSVEMGKDLYNNFKVAKEVFEEACDSIHFDLKKLCFEGPKQELEHTFNTQPALLTVSIAAYRVLLEECGLKADFMAGHSLGEYSALTASESIGFADAVKLVRFRGKVMSEAAGKSTGKMAAILGLSRDVVKAVIEDVRGDGVLTAANYNCPGQIIISGHKETVKKAMEVLKEKGAKRAIRLAVSGPFHSELMQDAAEKLQLHLDNLEFKEPKCTVYSNVTAKPYSSAAEIAPLLVRQIKSPVMWEDTVNDMIKEDANIFVELGSGRVLSGLIKRIDKEVLCCNIYNTGSLRDAIKTYKTMGKKLGEAV
jgi:[acyl-carrier-protein] S-malonyltransferase